MTVTMQRGSLEKLRDETIFYPHQISGVRTLARRTSFLLADEMGLGKSLQALAVAAIDFEEGTAMRVLIVAPASLKWNWQAEIEEHSRFTSLVLDGTKKQRSEWIDDYIINGDYDILIVNYEQVVAHLDELNACHFDIAIFDEAHYLKSHKAKRTKACHALNARRCFLLTGSPILNQIDDLWSLLHRIDRTEYPSYWKFLHRYAVYGGYQDKQIVGIKNQAELAARLDNVMLRREKKNVLDLPEKLYINLTVDLHPEQAKLYKQASDDLKIDLPDNPNPMELENALTKMLRLKQICGTTAAIEGYPDHSTKLDLATERVVEIIGNGEPVVLFTQFRSVQACMLARLHAAGVHCYQLNGDTPMKARRQIVDDWSVHQRTWDHPAALVAMIQVAGVGLTMTAASKCIFLDKDWSPKINEQAEDRLHRIGASKTKPIEIISISCRKTVEARVEQILRRKAKTFAAIVEHDDWKKKLIETLMEEDAA